jgi:DNA polymerase IV (DinB-like DNA polymerase)
MHIDLDYFFAQCEERENPSLKEKPVVVCVYSARGGDSGVVSTANYVARQFGVKSSLPIVTAKKILKNREAVFLPVNHELYEKVSAMVMSVLRRHADKIEQVGIDEAFLDVTKSTGGDFEKARTFAQAIKAKILAEEGLTCSIGIGPNKLVAKMASGFQKPDGLTVVRPEEVKKFLFPLPVGKLYGVGSKTAKKMQELGISTVGDLANYDVEKLREIFGKNLGTYYHNAANGLDMEPIREEKEVEQISRMTTLKQDTRDLNLILPELDRLSEDVHTRIIEDHLIIKSVGVIAVMRKLSTHSRSRTLEAATNQLDVIQKTARELFKLLLTEVTELDVRRAGVKVSGLSHEKGQKAITEFLGFV